MFTLVTDPLKKCFNDPRALFSVSRSSSVNGISCASNHSAKATISPVLPTPPLPPMVKTMRLFVFSVFIAILLGQRVSTVHFLRSESASVWSSARLSLPSVQQFGKQHHRGLARSTPTRIRAEGVRTALAFGVWREP